MKKLLSTHYSAGAFNTALLLLRVALGGLMMKHGYDKLIHFAQYKAKFINFMVIDNCVKHIKRRGTDVAINNSECYN